MLSLDAALGVVVVASALSVALDALFGTDDDGRAYSRHSAGERSIMKLGDVFERVTDADVPIGFRAYDGSMAGPRDARGVVVVRSPAAVRNFVSAPSELGLARAYVTGAIEVHGELHDVLKALDAHRGKGLGWRDALVLLRRCFARDCVPFRSRLRNCVGHGGERWRATAVAAMPRPSGTTTTSPTDSTSSSWVRR